MSPTVVVEDCANNSSATSSKDVIKGEVRVASLNCWGLLIYPDKSLRFTFIAKHLLSAQYDVVCLQEVFSGSDWNKLCADIKEHYPHSHYWKSGIVGSGLGILSRWPIVRVGWHRYHMNGSPYFLTHGDWYAGKGVAMARIAVDSKTNIASGGEDGDANVILVDVYNTHIHAEYTKKKPRYTVHQLAQLIEFRKFVENNSNVKDGVQAVFAVGDLNVLPESDMHRAVFDMNAMSHGHFALGDAWTEAKVPNTENDPAGFTYNLPIEAGNKYFKAKSRPQRIDYIKFAAPGSLDMICTNAGTLAAYENVTLSDHALLTAKFTLFQPVRNNKNFATSAATASNSSLFEARSQLDELNGKVSAWIATEQTLLKSRRAWFRALSIITTVVFLGLFVGSLVLVAFPTSSVSTIGVAAMVSVVPIPLTASLIFFVLGEFVLPEELSALATFSEEWQHWYLNEK